MSQIGAIKVTLLNVSIAQERSGCDRNDFLVIYDGEPQRAVMDCLARCGSLILVGNNNNYYIR